MSFWDLNDQNEKIDDSGEFDGGGGNIEPIPDGTGALAAIEEAKWDEYQDDEYISLKWRVIQPEAYKNRVVYQKVRVKDADPKKADKAKRMLAAIDTNAGGKLRKLNQEPADTDLMTALLGKTMAIKIMVWEIDDKTGNWIAAVSPGSAKSKPAAEPAPQQPIGDLDVPF